MRLIITSSKFNSMALRSDLNESVEREEREGIEDVNHQPDPPEQDEGKRVSQLHESSLLFVKSFLKLLFLLKVRFVAKPHIHTLRVWSYAYQAHRKGDYWQQCALDRERFKRRIQNLEVLLSPILLEGHRDKVHQERFH